MIPDPKTAALSGAGSRSRSGSPCDNFLENIPRFHYTEKKSVEGGRIMQLRQLVYFATVAEQGSINKAAEKLFTTQPNLSKAIGNLESELNVTIFDRTNKGVVLTDNGKKLYQYARTIMNQMELIQGLSAEEAPRTLSIASYPIITMSRLVSEFYHQNRHKELIIKLLEKRLQKVLELVESGEAEIGFVMSNNVQNKELRHMLNFKDLELHKLGMDTWYINLGPSHPLYDREVVEMGELLEYPFVRLPDDYFSNLTHYLEIGGVRLQSFKRKIYVSDSAAIITLLRETDAVRFGPGLSREDLAAYGIRTIPIRNNDVRITVGWVQRKREVLSPEARDFVTGLERLYPPPETE